MILARFINPQSVAAENREPAILVIGGSYGNGSPPFNDRLVAPFGGIAVGFGSYLSLGSALTRSREGPGFVINQAEAGATTFSRLWCVADQCGPAGWHGHPEQLSEALHRVAVVDPEDPSKILYYNAQYLVVSLTVDCLHSDAFGIPQSQTEPCGADEMNGYIERLLATADTALELGIRPVFTKMPEYRNLDLPMTRERFGLLWVIDEPDYNTLKNLHEQSLENKAGVLLVEAWRGFRHLGDGLHPTPATVEVAARRIMRKIRSDRYCNSNRSLQPQAKSNEVMDICRS